MSFSAQIRTSCPRTSCPSFNTAICPHGLMYTHRAVTAPLLEAPSPRCFCSSPPHLIQILTPTASAHEAAKLTPVRGGGAFKGALQHCSHLPQIRMRPGGCSRGSRLGKFVMSWDLWGRGYTPYHKSILKPGGSPLPRLFQGVYSVPKWTS